MDVARSTEESPPLAAPAPQDAASDRVSGARPATTEVLGEIFETAKQLAPIEYALAKEEFDSNVRALRRSIILFAVALVLLGLCVNALACYIIVSSESPGRTALGLSGGLLILSGLFALVARKMFPRLLEETQQRALRQLKKIRVLASD